MREQPVRASGLAHAEDRRTLHGSYCTFCLGALPLGLDTHSPWRGSSHLCGYSSLDRDQNYYYLGILESTLDHGVQIFIDCV